MTAGLSLRTVFHPQRMPVCSETSGKLLRVAPDRLLGNMSDNPGLREFMNRVEERLKAYSREQLMTILLEWAVKTPPGKRAEFLEKLFPLDVAGIKQESGPELLKEIRALAKRVDEGSYGEAQGEDYDFYDAEHYDAEQADESWASEIDEFMQMAHDCVIDGKYSLARDAYAMLFGILDSGEESGHLPGSYDPFELLETDIDEARSSYLLSIYLSSPGNSRATNMVKGMRYFGPYVGDSLNLKSVAGAGLAPLPDFDRFLKSWIELLRRTEDGFARYLLREAVILSGGVAGIADLARRDGQHHPSAYVEWMKLLEKEGDFSGMEEAAREGLRNVPADYVMRAKIGEYLASAGKHLGHKDTRVYGFHEAFYSKPSMNHLLSLLDATGSTDAYQKEIDASITRINSLMHRRDNEGYRTRTWDNETEKSFATEDLLVETYLLGGRHREAFDAVFDEKSLGWSHGLNQKGLVLYFFLKLLARDGSKRPAPNIELIWKDITGSILGLSSGLKDEGEIFRKAMEKVLRSISLSADERKMYVQWCVKETGKRVDAIVGEKHRQSYHKAAALLVASAEMLRNQGDLKAGEDLIDTYRMKYNRHSAFQDELRNSIRTDIN